MKIRLISFTTLVFAILILFSSFAEADPSLNKKYHYNLYWSGIKAGEAVLEYVETPEGFAIRTEAVSTKFISMFYKVDDRSETILYPDGYPKSSTLKISEGRHRKHKVTIFVQKTEESPQKIFFHNVLKDEKAEYELDKPAYDPLSGFYAMTQIPMQVGRTEYIKIFDSKKIFDAKINVLKKENIRVPAGKFDTIVINPILKTEGLFLRKGKMQIWLTDDDRKIPVKFKSKVKIGSFVAKLVKER
jgi:hypothetical protein